jgi:L-seryl-tRNA(Ser) seleniumtransferase
LARVSERWPDLDASAAAAGRATAALAMLLLRDHGILTVHFAALPPGTDALLLKFIPPEVLERFGGPDAFAAAVDAALDGVAELLGRPAELRSLLGRE